MKGDKEYRIIEPVVNLRRAPETGKISYYHDEQLVTQLLFNERVSVKGHQDRWALVEALEQETFRSHGYWEGYPGWVEKESLEPARQETLSDIRVVKSAVVPVLLEPDEGSAALFALSLGTRVNLDHTYEPRGNFSPIQAGKARCGWIDSRHLRFMAPAHDEERQREEIVAAARLFLGTPYLWGGRSMHMPGLASIATGVDCSGLVNLVFRISGIDLPRDAHEQWMKTGRLTADSIKTGDLIFIAPSPEEVTHVMLYMGGEHFIEAVESGTAVGMNTFENRFGVSLAAFPDSGRVRGQSAISFGRAPLCP